MNFRNHYLNLKTIFTLSLGCLVFSYFLLLGRDNSEAAKFSRFYAQAALFCLAVFFAAKHKTFLKPFYSPTCCIFSIFVFYQLVRYGVALSPKTQSLLGMNAADPIVNQLAVFPLQWIVSLGLFWILFQAGSFRTIVISLGRVFVWAAFFLAVNGLPPLLLTGRNFYRWADGNSTYFFPFLYGYEWVEKYILIRVGHVNITGDIIALGVFPAMGFAIYSLHLWRTSRQSGESPMPGDESFLKGPIFITLYVLAAMTSVACLLLHLSRGTMASFFAALAFFCFVICLRFIRKKYAGILLAGLVLSFLFLAWSANLPKVVSELLSLQGEKGQQGMSSFANEKGKIIAKAIHHKYPLWGVGNNGYAQLAEKYDPEYSEVSRPLYHSAAFSHYFQIQAEQGAGAFLYFLFLTVWLVELVTGLVRSKSYFRFIMALSFACGVIQVLTHASFGFLMDHFPTAALTYMGMAVSLAIVKKSFRHE